jgi:cobalt-zinc-cadmium efflux system protein
MGHAHGHGHGHGHGHDHGSAGGRLGLAFGLNVAFTLVELVGAWFTNSTAIAADAVHDLGDSLALAFAWGMQGLSDREPTSSFSYGFKRLSLVGALVNAVVLLVGGGLVLVESVPRLWSPGAPDARGMLLLAVLGVLVNGAAVLRVRTGSSLNEQVVTWHLLEDVLGWVAVLVVSIVMLFVEAPVLDPLLSIAITSWVGWNAAKNLRRTLAVFLQAVPDGVEIEALKEAVQAIDGVVGLEHVHVWSQEGEHHVLTGHLVVDRATLDEAAVIRAAVRSVLREAGIHHTTLEVVGSGGDDDPGLSCG